MKISKLCFIFIIISVLAVNIGKGQQKLEPKEKWYYELYNSDADYYKILTKWDAIFEKYPELKADKTYSYKNYLRWKNFWRTRVSMYGKPAGKFTYASEASKSMSLKSIQPELKSLISLPSWQQLGITSFPTQQLGWTESVAVDLTDPNLNTIYAGARIGAWKTTDGGQTWRCITDGLSIPVLTVQHIEIDPNNHNVLYLATGTNSILGASSSYGVLKSVNGGESWSPTGLIFDPEDAKMCYKVIVDPRNSNRLYAIVNQSVYRSSNAGGSWEEIVNFPNSFYLRDIEMKPDNSNVLYVSTDSYGIGFSAIFRTNNATSLFPSWELISDLAWPITDRIALAVTPDAPNNLYAAFAEGTTFHIKKSVGAGSNWSTYVSEPIGTNFKGTGYFKLELEISPTDADVMYVGGDAIDKITNQGNTIVHHSNNWNNLHIDVRSLLMVKGSIKGSGGTNDVLVCGNDGGISKTVNGSGSWTNINGTGYATSLFNNIGISDIKPGFLGGGTQDNGGFIYNNGIWTNYALGDGDDMVFDRNDFKRVYLSAYGGGVILSVSTNSGLTWTYNPSVIAQPPGAGSYRRHIHMNNNNVLYVGNHDVCKYNEGSKTWTTLSDFSGDFGIATLSVLQTFEVAPSNPNVIYASYLGPTRGDNTMRIFYKTSNAESSNPLWTDLTQDCFPIQWAPLTDIEIDPDDPQRVWVSFGGYWKDESGSSVYRVIYSSNGFDSWTDMSNGLPYIPINCIKYQAGSDDVIYAGTDNGVYYYNKTEGRWEEYNNGLPTCLITELEINLCSGKLQAATYGRGVWEVDLVNDEYKNYPVVFTKDATWDATVSVCSDVTIPNGKTLTITEDAYISNDSKVVIQYGGKIILDGASFITEDGLPFEGVYVNDGGYLNIKTASIHNFPVNVSPGGTVSVENALTIEGSGAIDIAPGAYICVLHTAISSITLQDALSVINLHPGYLSGVNTSVIPTPKYCINPISLLHAGNGSINNYTTDNYVQNEIITSDKYVSGRYIYVGRAVTTSKPEGAVIVKNGATIILDAEEEVIFEEGFEAEAGGDFQLK